jgi:hypothetical protein
MSNTPCELVIDQALESRLQQLKKLFKIYCEDPDASDDELGNIFEYGLCFDYVSPGTFNDQKEGYFRYQLSTGGPGDEFRFFVNFDLSTHRIEYTYINWFDIVKRELQGEEFQFMNELYQSLFVESGAAEAEYEKAIKMNEEFEF